MFFYICLYALLLSAYASSYGTLAGGRPNAFSEGQNAFAGVVNPANAVWIKDRIDIGGFWLHQRASLKNRDKNPNFAAGTTDTTYKAKNLLNGDIAIHKGFKLSFTKHTYEVSFSLATYTTPAITKVRTKYPQPPGTTPLQNFNKVQVISAVLSLKTNSQHSIGISIDYFQYRHKRSGFQRSDNPLRSISPGHVTNNGYDNSRGIGCTFGWRWNITKSLCFGAAWTKKSYCGQYRKYRGYEPRHARNYTAQTVGAGFRYRFSSKVSGRLEATWSNLGNTPQANDNFLANGMPNIQLRGSKHSPGPGLQDATFINVGLGYKLSEKLSFGAGLSHRIRLTRRNPSFLSHTYTHGTIYELLSLGANFKHQDHDFFFSCSHGFKSSVTGKLPAAAGTGRLTSNKSTFTISASWGYLY